MRIEEGFQLPTFAEGHPLLTDPALRSLLARILPKDVFGDIQSDLIRFGHDVSTNMRDLGKRVSHPTFTQYNQWGQRVDDLRSSEGFRLLQARAQEEGLPGIFYERKHGEHSRIHGFAKVVLMAADCHMVHCPLSMTDGAARVIELMGTRGMKEQVYPRLISCDSSRAYVSGQWMTERAGGSDVSGTETIAVSSGKTHALGEQYTLDGFKWFSSATESDTALALARTGSVEAGSRGLSLFLVPLRLPLLRRPKDPTPSSVNNNIFVHRLKNKFGTHPLPTAELSLQGAEGYLLGQLNQGVKSITPVLNITRMWSAASSVGYLRRSLAIAASYANVRAIHNGQVLLRDTPLHVAQLASINLTYRALTHLLFGTVRLLGRSECGVSTRDDELILRVLTPIVKGFAAEKASGAIEEAMTCLGGQGYMEETEIGRLLRDSLVEKIWEGTVTVLSLDVVRAFKDLAALQAFLNWSNGVIDSCPGHLAKDLDACLCILKTALDMVDRIYRQPVSLLAPRPALLLMGYVASALFLLEQAVWSHTDNNRMDVEVFSRWVREAGFSAALQDMVSIDTVGIEQRVAMNGELVFGPPSSTAKSSTHASKL